MELSSLTLSNIARTIGKHCHDMVLNYKVKFDIITKLLSAALELVLVTELESEILEFCHVLASILTALRIRIKQNYFTVLLMFSKCVRHCSSISVSDEVTGEIYHALLDASVLHFHPEVFESLFLILKQQSKQNSTLYDKFQRVSSLYADFKHLARFLKNSNRESDVIPVVNLLLQIPDQTFIEYLLPILFKHLRKFGGKPSHIIRLLSKRELFERVVDQLADLVSPVKSSSIGTHIAELMVNEELVEILKENMMSEQVIKVYFC